MNWPLFHSILSSSVLHFEFALLLKNNRVYQCVLAHAVVGSAGCTFCSHSRQMYIPSSLERRNKPGSVGNLTSSIIRRNTGNRTTYCGAMAQICTRMAVLLVTSQVGSVFRLKWASRDLTFVGLGILTYREEQWQVSNLKNIKCRKNILISQH